MKDDTVKIYTMMNYILGDEAMEKGLEGKRVVIAGSRKTEEMSAIIEKQGGIPIVRPMQGTVFLAEKEVEEDLRQVVDAGADWVILTTGIGTETLLDQAGKIGIRQPLFEILREAKVAARGYKTLGALKKLEISPVAVDDDGTTQGLIHALKSFDFAGQRVVVQLHGEPVPRLVQFLEEKGATVHQILPYRHIPPETGTVETLCREIAEGSLDAVCFTTAVQVRNLFEYARANGMDSQIREAFENDTLAAAVGKVTAEALREEGVNRILTSQSERMGAMIVELAQHYEG
jgi:uroporphyrinogen-III synthase